ncbi:MAG TPA: GNAT family N-acyltransferase [Candidatus Angelobacter sp.]|nr:GNAT family N-acyltransferase [Candidatus Angelobacter sp.]
MPLRNSLPSADVKDQASPEFQATGLSPLEKFFFVNPLREVYSRIRQPGGADLLERLLRELRIDVQIAPEDLERVPQTGPTLVVANHPFGILDGAILTALMTRVRKDVKLLSNYLVAAIEELAGMCIFVDPFEGASAHRRNVFGLRQAVSHLRNGGLLVMFPAGEVSHWQFRHGEVTDPEWSAAVARLVRWSGAPVVPVLFAGRNSFSFQALGVVHPKLRTIQLPREFLNKAGKQIGLRIGTPVPAEKIARINNDQLAASYLRWRTYLLRRRDTLLPHGAPLDHMCKVLPPADREVVISEIKGLGPENELEENREFQVFVADAGRIPGTMTEIGRQRELAFRDVGEGTGKEIDLDRFDRHYKHLILWHKKDAQIAGGYRFANTHEVVSIHGLQGLYTTTLFWIDPALFEHTGPALELGRSFIGRDYQKQFAPLLMLWKGIARYLSRHPQTAVLFGPVSISSTYNRTSRELLFQFFQSQRASLLAQWIRPKHPFRSRPVSDWELRALRHVLDLEEMSSSIAEIERDGKGLPVLLRQYLKLGGELLGFNVDKKFSSVLDGLILVDLRKTDESRLQAYMGADGAAAFLEHHGA